MVEEFSGLGKIMFVFRTSIANQCYRETLKRILAFPPDTKVEWKSHDSSIQQRTAIDDARKDKANQHLNSPITVRNGNKDN